MPGPRKVGTAGRVAGGFIGHPLVSRAYLEEELAPAVAAGLRERFGGLADRLTLSMPHTPDPALPMEVLASR